MKFTLLLLAIAAFTTAIAQDNQYKKQALPKYKSLPGVTVLADGSVVPTIKQTPPKFQKLPGIKVLPHVSIAPPENSIKPIPNAEFLLTLPNGNKVYALAQDKMPCIVPNMDEYKNRSITIQPYHYKGPDAIPNPAQPKK